MTGLPPVSVEKNSQMTVGRPAKRPLRQRAQRSHGRMRWQWHMRFSLGPHPSLKLERLSFFPSLTVLQKRRWSICALPARSPSARLLPSFAAFTFIQTPLSWPFSAGVVYIWHLSSSLPFILELLRCSLLSCCGGADILRLLPDSAHFCSASVLVLPVAWRIGGIQSSHMPLCRIETRVPDQVCWWACII